MELKIDKVIANEFQSFIKKLLAIDKFVFMKINTKAVSSTVYFPQKDAVKLVSVPLEQMFEIKDVIKDTIKVSFYNASRIIDALSYFGDDTIKGKIVYEQMGDEFIASDFVIFNDKLTIKLFCADPTLSFMDMSKDEIKRAFSTDNGTFKFDLPVKQIDNINSYFKLDKEVETFKFAIEDNILRVKGKNYDAILSETVEVLDESLIKVMVYKKYFPLLDKESYDVTVCTNKIFFKSQDTNTLLIIALCMNGDEEE